MEGATLEDYWRPLHHKVPCDFLRPTLGLKHWVPALSPQSLASAFLKGNSLQNPFQETHHSFSSWRTESWEKGRHNLMTESIQDCRDNYHRWMSRNIFEVPVVDIEKKNRLRHHLERRYECINGTSSKSVGLERMHCWPSWWANTIVGRRALIGLDVTDVAVT